MIERRFRSSCMSTRLVWWSATGAPTPTPALLTSTSRRPKRSRWRATTFWISSSEVRLAGTSSTSWPASRSSCAAPASFSGRRAATVSAWPSSPSMCAIASPMPLEAPVTRAARSAMAAEPTHSGTMATPFAVALAILVLLIGAAFASPGGDEGSVAHRPPRRAAAPAAPAASVATIARRVERIRGLRFRRLPRAVEVSSAQARREGLEHLDRSYPAARRRADEEVLKLLGLLAPSVDLRRVSASVFGDAVAGYYDPRSKRLRIVRGAPTSNRVLEEITLAHELTHALEDQRFGLALDGSSGSDDAALARLALVEGSATAVMYTYAQRHFSAA